MMQEMMSQCCDDDSIPNLKKAKAVMEKSRKQDFDEEELAMMCQSFRFYLKNHLCGPEGRADGRQIKKLFENCGFC